MDNETGIDANMIEKKDVVSSPLDYDNLRSLGIKLTQEFSADTWTDYNLHDPGLTILEYLCYAITDLAYRTGFKTEDILTSREEIIDNRKKEGVIDSKKNHFIPAREILSTNPVSINDFRKLLLDHFPEIENVWLEPFSPQTPVTYCKGLFKILIQYKHILMHDLRQKNESSKQAEKANIRQFINEHRNLGEIFTEIILLEPLEVKIKADILVKDGQLPELIMAEVYETIYRAFNPEIKFYSEAEMKQTELSAEEINQGPLLMYGFLKDEYLKPRPQSVDPTDVAKAVAGIKGVLRVKEFSITVNGKEYERESFLINNKDNKEQFLFFDYDNAKHAINLYQEDFKIPVKREHFINKLKIKLDHSFDASLKRDTKASVLKDNKNNLLTGLGKYRRLDHYVSIQYLFPEIYKLKRDIDELEKKKGTGNAADIAAIKQLKAYLMLFEQVMANYLSQLSNVDNIFSADITEKKAQTYFFQPVYDIPGAEKIINDFTGNTTWKEFKEQTENGYNDFLRRRVESETVFVNRKNRVLDHVLARFNIYINVYPLKLYQELYDKHKIEGRLTKLLLWKKSLLDNIVPLLRNRSQAYNYTQSEDNKIPGGFQQLMQQLLYIGIDTGSGMAGTGLRKLCPEFNAGDKRGFSIAKNSESKNSKLNGPLVFKQVNTAFFSDGLNADYYKIKDGDVNNKIQVLKFRAPHAEQGQDVGKFSDHYGAVKARDEFIEYLRKINIGSEGFHLVEHNLLLPPYHESISSFGFKITDAHGHAVCRHNECTLYSKRDENINKLLAAAKKDMDSFISFLEKESGNICKFPIDHDKDPLHFYNISMLQHHYKSNQAGLRRIFSNIKTSLMEIAERNDKSRSKIVSLIKYANEEVVEEDFFNLRLTVVLPGWPARFQDDKFRDYINKLFTENAPAHIRLDFIWLNFEKMKNFETLYFNWLSEMSKTKTGQPALELANSLIEWLRANRNRQ